MGLKCLLFTSNGRIVLLAVVGFEWMGGEMYDCLCYLCSLQRRQASPHCNGYNCRNECFPLKSFLIGWMYPAQYSIMPVAGFTYLFVVFF